MKKLIIGLIFGIMMLSVISVYADVYVGTFSVVGNDRACGTNNGNYNGEWNIPSGTTFIIGQTQDVCGGFGIYDVFTGNYVPYMEYDGKTDKGVSVQISSSFIVQEYCCTNAQPTSQSECNGGTFNTISCPNHVCKGNTQIPYYDSSYNYCSCATQTTLYYQSGSTCTSNTYCCSGSSCPTSTAGHTLYSSEATCESNIGGGTGTKTNGDTCTDGSECQSGFCDFGYDSWGNGGNRCIDISKKPICGSGNINNGDTCSSNTECGDTWAFHRYCVQGYCSIYSDKINCILKNGTKDIGQSCTYDTQCQSNHCEGAAWYLSFIGVGGKFCAAIPFSELKRPGIKRGDMSSLTIPELAKHVCLSKDNCLPSDVNDSVSCIPLATLEKDGTIPSTDSNAIFNNLNSIITGAAYGSIAGAGITGIVCTGTFAVAIFGEKWGLQPMDTLEIGDAIKYCTLSTGAITTGAVIGASFGYISINKNDPLVQKLGAKDANSVGICTEEATGGYCQYTEWAGFYTFPGMDKCTSGLIIIIIGIVVLVLIFKR